MPPRRPRSLSILRAIERRDTVRLAPRLEHHERPQRLAVIAPPREVLLDEAADRPGRQKTGTRDPIRMQQDAEVGTGEKLAEFPLAGRVVTLARGR